MKIKFISDFHSCFWHFNRFQKTLEHYLPPHEDDKDHILCCAGDMGIMNHYASTYKPLFNLLGKRFREVIMCPGNHSYYQSVGLWGNEQEFWQDKKLPKNVTYLDNRFVIIDDVVFIGSCLWTNFDHEDPLAMYHTSKAMNDFQGSIKLGSRNREGPYVNSTTYRLTPEMTVERHRESVAYIKETLGLFRGKKCVVITHHAPSAESVDDQYKGDLLNAAYYSDLSELILEYQPTYWQHGHMHDSKDYPIGVTRVICNPLGYHCVEINKKFNPNLVVEI